MRKYKVALLEYSPSWHHPELYKQLASHRNLDLMVYFCSRSALNGQLLSEAFDAKGMSWGENLLQGYDFKFLKNYPLGQPKIHKTRLFTYFNPEIWSEIRKGKYDAIVVSMWNDITPWLAVVSAKLSREKVLFIGDSTVLTEAGKPLWLRLIKKVILGKLLFPMGSGFLFRDEVNRQFFQQYGVPDERLFFYPYSVDYELYHAQYQILKNEKESIRQELGLGKDALVVLFVGRLCKEKRPLDLIKAFEKINIKDKTLIFVGGGVLADELNNYVDEKRIHTVRFTGFKPRAEILRFYLSADIFVLPSGLEPHGLVVNEAMCFGLPIIVSDQVGAAGDLVKHGENGFVYDCGDISQLAGCLEELADKATRDRYGQKSLELVKSWDHKEAVSGLVNALGQLCNGDIQYIN